MKNWIYDIETYPNIFTFAVSDEDENISVFEISDRKREANELRRFLGKIYSSKGRMIGFNNLGFDYPVIHYFLNNKGLQARDLYNKAMEIINSQDKFEHIIWDRDIMIPQLDLYKIYHFDNKAKATSLKMIEFNMRSDNIEDLPFAPGMELNDEQKDVLIRYNKHDVLQTLKFFRHSKDAIAFREELSEKYERNFMNHNDTKIGKDYFIMELEKEIPGSCYRKEGNRRVPNQTHRKTIKLKDAIVPYIKFDRPEFKAIHKWFMLQEIKETKGVFTDILESDLGNVAKYANMTTKKKKLPDKPSESEKEKWKKQYPLCWFEEKELKTGKISYYVCWRIAEALNVVVDDNEYVLGNGGIHMSVESTIVRADENTLIIDQDVN